MADGPGSMLSLADELLEPIIADLDRSDCVALGLTHPRFVRIVRPRIFSRIVVTSGTRARDAVSVLRPVAADVKQLHVLNIRVANTLLDGEAGSRDAPLVDDAVTLGEMSDLIRALPAVERLELRGTMPGDVADLSVGSLGTLDRLAELVIQVSFGEGSWTQCQARLDGRTFSHRILSSLSPRHLRTLRLADTCNWDAPFPQPTDADWPAELDLDYLETSSALRVLRPLDSAETGFRRLRALSLVGKWVHSEDHVLPALLAAVSQTLEALSVAWANVGELSIRQCLDTSMTRLALLFNVDDSVDSYLMAGFALFARIKTIVWPTGSCDGAPDPSDLPQLETVYIDADEPSESEWLAELQQHRPDVTVRNLSRASVPVPVDGLDLLAFLDRGALEHLDWEDKSPPFRTERPLVPPSCCVPS